MLLASSFAELWTMAPNTVASRRRWFFDLARKRARPGSGSSREFLLRRTWKALDVEVKRLRTPMVVVGGVATALYMSQRVTPGLNVLVLSADAPALHDELAQLDYIKRGALAIGGTSWESPDGSLLDVLESAEPWARAAIERPNCSPTGEPVIALPYLALMKLAASRPQDLADLARMLAGASDAVLDEVRAVVRRYRPTDADDLESLVHLGRLELESPE